MEANKSQVDLTDLGQSSTPRRLDHEQRRTLERISGHPLPRNLKWPSVISLLRAMGAVIEDSPNRYRATINGRTEVFQAQPHKDVPPDVVMQLRHFLND